MPKNKEILTTKLLPKELIDKNKVALDIIDFYSRVSDIIERTYIAMGKKTSYKILSSSTINNEKLSTNVYASTH